MQPGHSLLFYHNQWRRINRSPNVIFDVAVNKLFLYYLYNIRLIGKFVDSYLALEVQGLHIRALKVSRQYSLKRLTIARMRVAEMKRMGLKRKSGGNLEAMRAHSSNIICWRREGSREYRGSSWISARLGITTTLHYPKAGLNTSLTILCYGISSSIKATTKFSANYREEIEIKWYARKLGEYNFVL